MTREKKKNLPINGKILCKQKKTISYKTAQSLLSLSPSDGGSKSHPIRRIPKTTYKTNRKST